MLPVKCNHFVDLGLNLFLIVSHKLVKRYSKEISQRLQKRNVGISLSPLPFADCCARDVHCNGKLLLRDVLSGTQAFDICTDSHFHINTSSKGYSKPTSASVLNYINRIRRCKGTVRKYDIN